MMAHGTFIQRGVAEWERLTPAVETCSDSMRQWWRARWIEAWQTYWAPLKMLKWLVFRSWRF